MTDGPTRGPGLSAPAGAKPSDRQALWARTLLDALAQAGIQQVIISPGSRSTPFVLAAAAHPELICHHVMDERSAAYFALGQGRLSGRPSLLICTSGTAVANYLPAVVEASMAHVPLVVLSADRPVELAHCGANQTIDQLKIFGHHARQFFDLGRPDTSPRALRALRRTAAQAVFAADYPLPGAVHLNARAKKPLEPSTVEEPVVRNALVRPRRPLRLAATDDLDLLIERLGSVENGVLVAGPAAVTQGELGSIFSELARRSGFVVFADPASQWRFRARSTEVTWVDAYDSLLHGSGFRRRHRPELIVQFGRVPTSGAFERFLGELSGVEHWVLGPHGWNDPQSTADHLVFADLAPTLDSLVEGLPADQRPPSEWQRAWRRGERLAQRLIQDAVSGDGGEQSLSEGQVARCAVDGLPPGGLLVLGNSLPIREVDIYCRGTDKALAVASQRGTSGIDGVVSGALGAAHISAQPTVLLVGDVSFLHDLSGLTAASLVTSPMVILVVQNQGGHIFDQLPVAAYLAAQEPRDADGGGVMDHWTTPHQCDLEHAAALHGLPFRRVRDHRALAQGLKQGLGRRGVTLIEAVVPPGGAAEQTRRLRKGLQEALAEAELV